MLYWAFGRAKAVRQGKWKLVKYGNARWELYNMDEDRTELNNLAGKYPERVKEMTGMWDAWSRKCREKP